MGFEEQYHRSEVSSPHYTRVHGVSMTFLGDVNAGHSMKVVSARVPLTSKISESRSLGDRN